MKVDADGPSIIAEESQEGGSPLPTQKQTKELETFDLINVMET